MFVELEDGELLNLDYVVNIRISKGTGDSFVVEAVYVRGNNLIPTTIRRGTKQQCDMVLAALRHSLVKVLY